MRVPPFPVVYFGVIAAALLLDGGALVANLPSIEQLSAPSAWPSRESASLVAASVLLVPFLAVWRAGLKKFVFASWAKDWAGLDESSPIFGKFIEQAWLACHYSLITILELAVLWNKPWWPPVISAEADAALDAPPLDTTRDQQDWGLCTFYCVQLAFYALELVTLLSGPRRQRRSDFTVYLFHHLYTVWLLTGSWLAKLHRVGSLVLILHDVGDVFLPIGKCYSYAEKHIRATRSKAVFEFHKNVGTFFFVLFIIFFAIPRLFFFGGLISSSMKQHHWFTCCGERCDECPVGPFWGMHVFWFMLIVRMAAKVLMGQYDDERSGDEDCDDDKDEKKAGAANGQAVENKKKR